MYLTIKKRWFEAINTGIYQSNSGIGRGDHQPGRREGERERERIREITPVRQLDGWKSTNLLHGWYFWRAFPFSRTLPEPLEIPKSCCSEFISGARCDSKLSNRCHDRKVWNPASYEIYILVPCPISPIPNLISQKQEVMLQLPKLHLTSLN